MLLKAIDRLVPDYSLLKNSKVFIWLLSLSLFLRLPFVFRDYIDRDESTFILVAQGWVDGFLPYTVLWDLKPPITFLFFSALIYVFGKSLIAIRIAGILTVSLIAFFTYLIGKQLTDNKVSFWSATFTVFLISMFGSLQGVMSEHISMLFFMPALYLLIRNRDWQFSIIAGVLMGAALMTKINLAYPVLFLGLYLIYDRFKLGFRMSGLGQIFAFAAGVILTIGLTILPYYLEGKTQLWWDAVILAPLEYAGVRRHSPGRFLPLLIFLILLFSYGTWKRILPMKNSSIQLLLIAMIGIVIAFIRGGRINGHYLIQLHPVLIIIVGIVISATIRIKKWKYQPFVLLVLLLLPFEAYKEYRDIIRHKIERGSFLNGEGYTVPDYIRKENLSTENILFMEYHIGYWFLNTLPPTKSATHPTNICRDETFQFYDNPRTNSMEELRYIMEDIAPEIVVTRNKWRIFDKKQEEENTYIRSYLDQHYTIEKEIDNAEIHRRL